MPVADEHHSFSVPLTPATSPLLLSSCRPGSFQLLLARSADWNCSLPRTRQPDQPFTCSRFALGNLWFHCHAHLQFCHVNCWPLTASIAVEHFYFLYPREEPVSRCKYVWLKVLVVLISLTWSLTLWYPVASGKSRRVNFAHLIFIFHFSDGIFTTSWFIDSWRPRGQFVHRWYGWR